MKKISALLRRYKVEALVCILSITGLVYSTVWTPQRTIAFRRSHSFERMQSQTVLVETDHGFGSGVVIHRGGQIFVWTAAHVARNVSSVIIHQSYRYAGHKAGEQVFKGRVICRLGEVLELDGTIKGTDAALIWVDAPPDKLTGATWASTTPAVGEPVFHCGNFLGPNYDGSLSKGIVSQIGVRPANDSFPWELVDQSDITCLPGSSGGPIFNSSGQVVGLLVGGPGSNVSCFVPVRILYAAAQKLNVSWALYGSYCPPVHILEDAVKAAAPPPVVEQPVDIIRLIIGGAPQSCH